MDDPARKATGQLGSYAYTSKEDIEAMTRERSAGDVLKDIIGNVQEIIRSEVRLAKVETVQEIGKAGTASKIIAIGGVLGLYGGAFILLAIVYALSTVMAAWLAALIVGIALAIPAAVMVSRGMDEIKRVSPAPERTIETVKENVEWMKNQTR